jgi:hypothetical protein
MKGRKKGRKDERKEERKDGRKGVSRWKHHLGPREVE